MSDDPSGDQNPVKRKKAIALSYAENDRAPRVVATGAGEIARKILELAKENNVPIQEDESLTSVLSKLDLGYEIPPETFRAVAEILAFLYRTEEEWRKRKEEQNPTFTSVMEKSASAPADGAGSDQPEDESNS